MNDCAVLGIRLDQCNPAAAAYAAARKSQIQQAAELFLLQRPDSTGGGADAEQHVDTLSGVRRPLHTRQAPMSACAVIHRESSPSCGQPGVCV